MFGVDVLSNPARIKTTTTIFNPIFQSFFDCIQRGMRILIFRRVCAVCACGKWNAIVCVCVRVNMKRYHFVVPIWGWAPGAGRKRTPHDVVHFVIIYFNYNWANSSQSQDILYRCCDGGHMCSHSNSFLISSLWGFECAQTTWKMNNHCFVAHFNRWFCTRIWRVGRWLPIYTIAFARAIKTMNKLNCENKVGRARWLAVSLMNNDHNFDRSDIYRLNQDD